MQTAHCESFPTVHSRSGRYEKMCLSAGRATRRLTRVRHIRLLHAYDRSLAREVVPHLYPGARAFACSWPSNRGPSKARQMASRTAVVDHEIVNHPHLLLILRSGSYHHAALLLVHDSPTSEMRSTCAQQRIKPRRVSKRALFFYYENKNRSK